MQSRAPRYFARPVSDCMLDGWRGVVWSPEDALDAPALRPGVELGLHLARQLDVEPLHLRLAVAPAPACISFHRLILRSCTTCASTHPVSLPRVVTRGAWQFGSFASRILSTSFTHFSAFALLRNKQIELTWSCPPGRSSSRLRGPAPVRLLFRAGGWPRGASACRTSSTNQVRGLPPDSRDRLV
jgi:hypothetical protein